jgi:hypothetical protein
MRTFTHVALPSSGLPALLADPASDEDDAPVLLFLHGKGEAGSSRSPSMTSTTSSRACAPTAPSWSAKWCSTRTRIGSATSAAPRASWSGLPSSSARACLVADRAETNATLCAAGSSRMTPPGCTEGC